MWQIALMGGSYERVENDSKNAMLRQRAESLLTLELLMGDAQLQNSNLFPEWIYWYCLRNISIATRILG